MLSTGTFHPFQRLPPELRQQIWRHALPLVEDIKPALFFYTDGLWKDVTRNFPPEDYVNHVHLEFQDQQLHPVAADIPFAQVNHEANTVALSWAKHEGLTGYKSPGSGFIVAEKFNPLRHGLYIDHQSLLNLIGGCEDQRRLHDPESLANTEVVGRARVNYLALPLDTLRSRGTRNFRYFQQDYFDALDELWLVKGPKPQPIDVKPRKPRIRRRWTIEDITGDPEDHELIQRIKRELSSWFVSEATRNLKYRLVRAVLV